MPIVLYQEKEKGSSKDLILVFCDHRSQQHIQKSTVLSADIAEQTASSIYIIIVLNVVSSFLVWTQ